MLHSSGSNFVSSSVLCQPAMGKKKACGHPGPCPISLDYHSKLVKLRKDLLSKHSQHVQPSIAKVRTKFADNQKDVQFICTSKDGGHTKFDVPASFVFSFSQPIWPMAVKDVITPKKRLVLLDKCNVGSRYAGFWKSDCRLHLLY